ncbi:RNA polymerase sigma factor [Zavarzinella formosa]|uniref:RNA polymerase sigma factor n=1 Tax=Zavarzinella formosa TaxID=360055 RepID=UPI0002E952B5|nr:sigma factor [Zavarzinella formosa]
MSAERAADDLQIVLEVIRKRVQVLSRRNRFTPADREELGQELFRRFWPKMAGFDPERGDLGGYAHVAVRRLSLNLMREWNRRVREGVRAGGIPADQLADRSDPLADAIRAADLAAMIRSLPPPLRELAGELRFKNASQVAREQRITRSAVRGMIRRIAHRWSEIRGETD